MTEPIAFYGIDRGKADGDMTALSALCSCGRLYTITWDGAIEVKPIALHCVCGLVSPARSADGEESHV